MMWQVFDANLMDTSNLKFQHDLALPPPLHHETKPVPYLGKKRSLSIQLAIYLPTYLPRSNLPTYLPALRVYLPNYLPTQHI